MDATERVEIPRPMRHCAVHEQYTEGCASCFDEDSAGAARLHEWEKSEELRLAQLARMAASSEAPSRGDSPEGFKLDGSKNRLELVPPELIEAVGSVLTAGLAKYPPDNWKRVPGGPKRYSGALLRHLCAAMRGEDLDPDTGLPHVFHVAANAAFLVWFRVNGHVRGEDE